MIRSQKPNDADKKEGNFDRNYPGSSRSLSESSRALTQFCMQGCFCERDTRACGDLLITAPRHDHDRRVWADTANW